VNPEIEQTISAMKAEEMCMSPLKAIASPQILINW
jgi:hypothetical protein